MGPCGMAGGRARASHPTGTPSMLARAYARVPDLRLPVPVHGGRRGALVPQPRRAAGGGGARGDLPDATPVGARRAPRPRSTRARRVRGPTHGAVYGPAHPATAHRPAAGVRRGRAVAPAAPRAPL